MNALERRRQNASRIANEEEDRQGDYEEKKRDDRG